MALAINKMHAAGINLVKAISGRLKPDASTVWVTSRSMTPNQVALPRSREDVASARHG
jgi:hypothetical protein